MSTPDAQDKKVPQFSSFTMRPATAPAESCCTDHACATESAPAAEALSDARYRWQVDGMDCAACARKVETAVPSGARGQSGPGAVRHRKAAG
ncbi:Lead, cadmium, zinc and mercury transporting ATPase [Klebsiella pneumoniae subsp. pneumoniae]|nr:Lead, cadmium, zinc and mercury transporting ATPase [Klebsiella pneumoniae subsp. pneumoniae]